MEYLIFVSSGFVVGVIAGGIVCWHTYDAGSTLWHDASASIIAQAFAACF